MRVAILGTYKSGTSVVTNIMEAIGFEIGHPLFNGVEPFFESDSLRNLLLKSWDEISQAPLLKIEERVAHLKNWVEKQEAKGNALVCGKHPVLCLATADLEAAWGSDCKVIRVSRKIQDSIASLVSWNWFGDNSDRMQRTLFASAEKYCSGRTHHKVDFEILTYPGNAIQEVRKLVEYLGIEVDEKMIQKAASCVKERKPK